MKMVGMRKEKIPLDSVGSGVVAMTEVRWQY
jgi:hypothetical protein